MAAPPFTEFSDYKLVLSPFTPAPDPVSLELRAHLTHPASKSGVDPGWHFRCAVELLFGKKTPGAHFEWSPWAEAQLDLAAEGLVEPEGQAPGNKYHLYGVDTDGWSHYPAVSGCASSGKTDFWAVWALLNWTAAPHETLVLVCSTSIKGAEGRIWGRMVKYFQAVQDMPFKFKHLGLRWPEFNWQWPGKIVAHEHCIRTVRPSGDVMPKECGIHLLALDRKKDAAKIGDYIGRKNTRVILIIDEMPDIGPGIMNAGFSNFSKNPWFQMVGMGNFHSIYDAFGEFTQPKDGWDTIHVEMDSWDTRYGRCLHLDGSQSPNILAGRSIWTGLYGDKDLLSDQNKYGPESSFFWRMCRSFPNLSGEVDKIYSDSDFIRGRAHDSPTWLGQPILCASLDPAFTTGGDRAILRWGYYGQLATGQWVLAFDGWEHLTDDVRNKQDSFDLQIARQFVTRLKERGVLWRHAGVDSTGAGISFLTLCQQLAKSKEILGVAFGGAASDLPIDDDSSEIGKDRYSNRVTELWFIGREWCRAGKWRGLDKETAKELCERKYDTVRNDKGTVVVAESKKDMKERGLRSPDLGDSVGVLQDVVRLNFGPGAVAGREDGADPFEMAADEAEEVFEDEYAYEEA